jgi:uncharacterized membrane protein
MTGLFALIGGICIFAGFRLTKRFSAVANYRGIGGFRLTLGGLAYYLGVILIVVGMAFVGVGILFPR